MIQLALLYSGLLPSHFSPALEFLKVEENHLQVYTISIIIIIIINNICDGCIPSVNTKGLLSVEDLYRKKINTFLKYQKP